VSLSNGSGAFDRVDFEDWATTIEDIRTEVMQLIGKHQHSQDVIGLVRDVDSACNAARDALMALADEAS
jgi:hypothetical protein